MKIVLKVVKAVCQIDGGVNLCLIVKLFHYGVFLFRDVLQPSFVHRLKVLASKQVLFLPACVGGLVFPWQTRKESKKKKKSPK